MKNIKSVNKKWYAISLLFLLMFIIFNYSIFLASKKLNIDSDFVAVQTMLKNANIGLQYKTWVNADTFIFKYPFYFLFNMLSFKSSIVYLQSVLQFSVGYIIFTLSLFYFIWNYRLKVKDSTFALIWLASSTTLIGIFLLNPNSRVMEFGFIFLAYTFIDYFQNKTGLTKFDILCIISISVFYGLLTYSDPFIFLMGLVPVLIYNAIFFFIYKFDKRYIYSVIAILAVYINYKIFAVFFGYLGITANPLSPEVALNLSLLPKYIMNSIYALLNIFSANILTKISLVNLANFITILIVFFVIFYNYLKSLKTKSSAIKNKRNYWFLFFCFLFIYQLSVYSFICRCNDTLSYRYLILLPFIMIFLVAFYFFYEKRSRYSYLIKLLMLLVISINILSLIHEYINIKSENQNSYALKDNFGFVEENITNEIAKISQYRNVSKTYSAYWEAAINTFKTNNKSTGIPVECKDNKIIIYKWWISDAAIKKPSNKTIFVYDSFYLGGCSIDDVIKQIGEPVLTHKVDDRVQLLEYNQDILDKIK